MKTRIHQLVRKALPVVDAYVETDAIRDYLVHNQALLVLEDKKPLGILTAIDIVKRKQTLVIDCMTHKPFVQPDHTVEQVLHLMKGAGYSVLPVQDNKTNFIGAIYIDDIVDFLYTKAEKQQAVVQSMVHDLKSPLANISSISEMLQQEDNDPEENKQLLSYVGLSVDIAKEIVNDLLLSEKLESEELELSEIELNSFISECVPAVKGLLAQKSLQLHLVLLDTPCYFKGDRPKLQRVVHNLLSNAIKFSHRDSNIWLSCFRGQSDFTIEITDEGVGIPEKLQPYIFDKFSKAKRKGTAGESTTGLGMHLSKEIVKLHNGDLWFKSEENMGTIFFIRLPHTCRNHSIAAAVPATLP